MSQLINDADDLIPFTGKKPDTLQQRMVQFSLSDRFEACLGEWELVSVFRQDNAEKSCLCTQGERKGDQILELNILRNIKTGDKCRVGSQCVKALMKGTQVEADLRLFWPLVTQQRRTISKKIANRSYQLRIITNWDLDTLLQIGAKRRPNKGQKEIIDKIKAMISLRISPPQPSQIQLICERFSGEKDNPFYEQGKGEEFYKNPCNKAKITLKEKAYQWYKDRYEKYEDNGIEVLSVDERRYMKMVIYFWFSYGLQETEEQQELGLDDGTESAAAA